MQIGIEFIAEIYSDLNISAKDFHLFHDSELDQFPRGVYRLTPFLEEQHRHEYKVLEADFYDSYSAEKYLQNTIPDNQDVYSVVFIGERKESLVPGRIVSRNVEIWLNSAREGDAPVLNHCWRRFCILKEICQAIIFEEYSRRGDDKIVTHMAFSEIDTLFNKINNEPFSLWDFDDPDYDRGVFLENAAELLTVGILFPFEHAAELRVKAEQEFKGKFSDVDYGSIAQHYQVPLRYVELLLTWRALPGFISSIKTNARYGI